MRERSRGRFPAPRTPPLTDAAGALLGAIRAHFDQFELEEIRSRRWTSATFQGARHALTFVVEGDGAGAAAERFLAWLDPRRFALRGHLVADVSLVAEDRRTDRTRISLEALTVEDR